MDPKKRIRDAQAAVATAQAEYDALGIEAVKAELRRLSLLGEPILRRKVAAMEAVYAAQAAAKAEKWPADELAAFLADGADRDVPRFLIRRHATVASEPVGRHYLRQEFAAARLLLRAERGMEG